MTFRKRVKFSISALLFIFFIFLPFIPICKQYLSIPNTIVTYKTDSSVHLPPLGKDYIVESDSSIVALTNSAIYPIDTGEATLVYKKNNIPVKKVNVSVLDEKKVVPGGQSIGVKLHTLGVLVVGHHLVQTNEKMSSPGEDANIQVGDVILEMDGKEIKQLEDVKPIVEKKGAEKNPIDVKLKRGDEVIYTKLQPMLNRRDNKYQIGLFIRDAASGIGTISFYDPETGKYGALGHVISDADTKKPLQIHDGKIVRSSIVSIAKGTKGIPGEKHATFSMNDTALGTIQKNSPFGIFGTLKQDQLVDNNMQPIPVAKAEEVRQGPAKMLTVIEGEKVEEFDVEIVHSVPQKVPSTKGMIVKITDERLIEKTGGIVQGMSGSPIIQDGKLIGAITHVFVNDPTSGYGVHIEWMLKEAGISMPL